MIGSSALDGVTTALDRVDFWWALAGGWAIDVWLGIETREHHDVEVVVRRRDRTIVWDALHAEFELFCLDPPGSDWREWEREAEIAAPAFQAQARAPSFTFDLFLETTIGDEWRFRRDSRVRRPLADIRITAAGIPIVRPEVQLLYMARSREPKNEHDFTVTAPNLDAGSPAWLRRALAIVEPRNPWIERLSRE